jgi:hypothetical protein
MSITLSEDQQIAYNEFVAYVLSKTETVFILKGYAGTGKSTLVEHLLNALPDILKTQQLIDPDMTHVWDVRLTATTNKAVEALREMAPVDYEVTTIHSALGLRVVKDYQTSVTKLVRHGGADDITDCIVFIDEASFIDDTLLLLIHSSLTRCKIVFIGDPAQITPVKSNRTPALEGDVRTASLTQVMRQAKGNLIIDLATQFRNTVISGEWFSFEPDGNYVQHHTRDKFDSLICTEMSRPDWVYRDSKVLAWTNKSVISYNRNIREHVQGEPEIQVGDYAVCNSHVKLSKNSSLRTDQTVQITSKKPDEEAGVLGFVFGLDGKHNGFMPISRDAAAERLKRARNTQDYSLVRRIEESWLDLRAAYSCTVDKSQGSTYDRVYIDLDDVGKCHNRNKVARMLYVGVSRARLQVFLTGDLV